MTNLINHPAINIVEKEWNAIMKNVSIAQYKVIIEKSRSEESLMEQDTIENVS